jgi:ABC-type uncharacterized transport system permease subunit
LAFKCEYSHNPRQMTSQRAKRFALLVIVPIAIAPVAAFFGMFLPIAVYETFCNHSFEFHNLVWESVFGIGFYLAAWVCHFFSLEYQSGPVGLIGVLLWPLVVMVATFMTARRVLQSSHRARFVWAAAFLLSLFICVGHDAENYLTVHGLPVYWNYCAVFY